MVWHLFSKLPFRPKRWSYMPCFMTMIACVCLRHLYSLCLHCIPSCLLQTSFKINLQSNPIPNIMGHVPSDGGLLSFWDRPDLLRATANRDWMSGRNTWSGITRDRRGGPRGFIPAAPPSVQIQIVCIALQPWTGCIIGRCRLPQSQMVLRTTGPLVV